MQYGIPLLGNRVAPRCTIAESLLLLSVTRNRVRSHQVVAVHQHAWEELVGVLVAERVETLVCGGISRTAKALVLSKQIDVFENVAGTAEEVTGALQSGTLCSGFGLQEDESDHDGHQAGATTGKTGKAIVEGRDDRPGTIKRVTAHADGDCLTCGDRICLRGQPCDIAGGTSMPKSGQPDRRILEAAMDIACEEGRTLCRLSELIYFCLDMKYRKLGLAFCIDLLEPADILAGVLRRFFEVYPVCCKVGGLKESDPIMNRRNEAGESDREHIVCNPLGQARTLNSIGTDLNVSVGLCMGMDCVFAGASKAPVTTLLVKDRSLANNPIGALYSEYYLKEATRPSVGVP